MDAGLGRLGAREAVRGNLISIFMRRGLFLQLETYSHTLRIGTWRHPSEELLLPMFLGAIV